MVAICATIVSRLCHDADGCVWRTLACGQPMTGSELHSCAGCRPDGISSCKIQLGTDDWTSSSLLQSLQFQHIRLQLPTAQLAVIPTQRGTDNHAENQPNDKDKGAQGTRAPRGEKGPLREGQPGLQSGNCQQTFGSGHVMRCLHLTQAQN
jgi:hypothetical protein